MRLVAKTLEKVVIELTTREVEKTGFDYHWDKIRRMYTSDSYDVHSIGVSKDNDQLIFIELVSNKSGK